MKINTEKIIFFGDGRDFHARDWYLTVKEVCSRRMVLLATDLIESEGRPRLVDKDNVSFGIPFFLYSHYVINNFHLETIKIKRNLIVYSIIVLITLLANNAILWISWPLFAIIGYCLLKTNNNVIQSS